MGNIKVYTKFIRILWKGLLDLEKNVLKNPTVLEDKQLNVAEGLVTLAVFVGFSYLRFPSSELAN